MIREYIFFLQQILFIVFISNFPISALAQTAIRGEVIYTMSGEKIQNGVILIRDGKIQKVGESSRVKIPEGYIIYNGKVITPGLIDAHATAGLSGIYNDAHDQDHLDKTGPMQPELRAIDAYNPKEELVGYLLSKGITTIHTGHSPGALISGQTMVVKTTGNTVEEALLNKSTMLSITLGSVVADNFKSPGTRSKGIALLRSDLLKAQQYLAKSALRDSTKRPSRDLHMEALGALLKGELKAMVTAHRATEIMSAIRLSKEFGFQLVLDGASEAYMLIDEIKTSKAQVILHPTMMRTYGDMKNASLETAAILHKAGIPFALQSGYESYVPKTRVVLYEAAIAVRYGLPFEAGLRSITSSAAEIIGQSKRIGSIEEGKDADVVIFDGDPFEYRTNVCQVFIDGKLLQDGCK